MRYELWPALICQLRDSLHCNQEVLADLIGVTPTTVSRWRLGRQIPDLCKQRRILDMLHNLEPEFLLRRDDVERVLSYAVVYSAESFGLCIAASERVAKTLGLRVEDLRFRDLSEFWTPSAAAASEAVVNSPAFKSHEMAYADMTVVCLGDTWLKTRCMRLGASDLLLSTSIVIEKPAHLSGDDFELEIITKDEIVG